MLELPEAYVIAKQIRETCNGKEIAAAAAAVHPHKMTWYHGDPKEYGTLLTGKTITGANQFGGIVQLEAEDTAVLLSDGANLRFIPAGQKQPDKHQLHLQFADGSALFASVQMYGGISAFVQGEYQNKYYLVAKENPSPLTADFDEAYFDSLQKNSSEKLSAKAFLATEQRIPGLGNGVLQDILWRAGIHPKRKLSSLSEEEKQALFRCVKDTLKEMTDKGSRDTERDLFGNPGGYRTVLSKNSELRLCPACGGSIRKEAYMGGSIYYCISCQPL